MIELEEREKAARRQEILDLQGYYKQSSEDKMAYEKMVDEVVQQEAERQFKMRDAQWQRENQARINLLKDVYQAREEAAARKTHQLDLLKQMNEKDRIQRTFLQEKMYEERAAKLAELEYQRKINFDKQQNATMLSQWKDSVKY